MLCASKLKTRTPLRKRAKRKRGKRIDYSALAFGKSKREVAPVKVFPDGREHCNLRTVIGRAVYVIRVANMWERQGYRCSIGGESIAQIEATFEHGNGRGAGKRDDRINIVDAEGYYINSAACGKHNCEKGSRRNYPLAIRLKPPAIGRGE